MYLAEHEKRSIELFGKPYSEIHQWLDKFAGSPEFGMRHRKMRHHLAGIEEAVQVFGEEIRDVARQHIIDDLLLEGWIEGKHDFLKNRSHYDKMGLF